MTMILGMLIFGIGLFLILVEGYLQLGCFLGFIGSFIYINSRIDSYIKNIREKIGHV